MRRHGHRISLPRYSEQHGWRGGDSHCLYTFIDKRTGHKVVRPGGAAGGIGSEVTVRQATRAEAEAHWQSPLHPGWKVKD